MIRFILMLMLVLGASGGYVSPRPSSAAPVAAAATDIAVAAAGETDPVPDKNDAADDPAIWIHPTDSSLSTIIASNKQSGIHVYGLDGKQLQYLRVGKINNIDLRYNVLLGGERVTLVVGSNQTLNNLVVYKINPQTRLLENVAARTIDIGMEPYGACLYHNATTGALYAFITRSPYPLNDRKINNGLVYQFELFDANGKIDARQVREFKVGSDTEGCVADDMTGDLYMSQTTVGIWKYSAEPNGGDKRVSIAKVNDGQLKGELEGISIYYSGERTGYLVVSSQCCAEFSIYQREAPNKYVMSFKVIGVPRSNIDDVSGTDGLDVTNAALGPLFPQGLFVVHDTRNTPVRPNYTNFKLVPWQSIAQAAPLPLTINTTWDPRNVGVPAVTPSATQTPPPTPAPLTTALPTLTSSPVATTSTTTPTNEPIATPTQALPQAGPSVQLYMPLLHGIHTP